MAKTMTFAEVCVGHIFKINGIYFIKIPILGIDQYNAITIHTDNEYPSSVYSGRPISFAPNTEVISSEQDGITKDQLTLMGF